MDMKNLPMCRICLVKNVRMYVFANTNLQEIYEKLTDTPLVTEDSRPMLACFICHAKLKQCHQLQRQCMIAEELFAQMMNEDYETNTLIKRGMLEFSEYLITPTQHISVFDDCHTESAVIKEEPPADCEGLEGEQQTDSEHECKDITDSQRSESGDTPPRPSESEDDSEDDLPLMEFKASQNKRKPEETKRTPGAKKSKLDTRRAELEDTITTRLKNTEQPDENTQNRTSKPTTEFKEPFTHTTPIVSDRNNVKFQDNSLKKWYNYCVKCKLSFSNSFDLMKHIRTHATDKPQISKSKRRFSLPHDLKKNIRQQKREKFYKCDICQYSFSQKDDLSKHIRVHNGKKPYTCEVCQHSFKRKYKLYIHSLIHTGEKPFQCHVCGQFYRNLSQHITHAHAAPYKCEICQRLFKYKISKYHIKKCSGVKSFTCDVCQQSYSDKRKLKNHIRIHMEKQFFKCDICQRIYVNKGDLSRHIKTHTNGKCYKCDKCQRSFSYAHHLKEHILIHTGEKPFVCKICQRGFIRSHHLKAHMVTHTGEKPFKCDVCQRRFNQANNLKQHIRIHTGEPVRRKRVKKA